MRFAQLAAASIVLCIWSALVSNASAQSPSGTLAPVDSTKRDSLTQIVFPTRESQPDFVKQLLGIVSIGGGPYKNVRDGVYRTDFQPTAHLELYARPSEALGVLVGGHLGFGSVTTSGFSLGLRTPIEYAADRLTPAVFGDLSALFFNASLDSSSFQTGVRAAIGGTIRSSMLTFEPKLVGEYRGSRKLGSSSETLFWAGLEVGVSFSLVTPRSERSYKDSVRAALRYIATSDELEDLDQIDSRSQFENWLERFWKKRDVTPATALNEAREEFEHRAALANAEFSGFGKLGVSTDPGRVLVVYGEPDDIETFPSTIDPQRSYRLWVYRKRVRGHGLAAFIFASYSGSEWRQVFSNVGGERTNGLPVDIPQATYTWLSRSAYLGNQLGSLTN